MASFDEWEYEQDQLFIKGFGPKAKVKCINAKGSKKLKKGMIYTVKYMAMTRSDDASKYNFILEEMPYSVSVDRFEVIEKTTIKPRYLKKPGPDKRQEKVLKELREILDNAIL